MNARKIEKQLEQERRIAESIIKIRDTIQSFKKLANDYYEHALKAAELNQNEYADELLEATIELEVFAEDFQYLELRVKTTAITARAFSQLSDLPETFKVLKKLFMEAPDFRKLGKDMGSLLQSLGTARKQLREFRSSLARGKGSVMEEIFGSDKKEEAQMSARLKEKKEILFAELRKRQAATAETPVEAASTVVDANDTAKVDDIARAIDEESKRN